MVIPRGRSAAPDGELRRSVARVLAALPPGGRVRHVGALPGRAPRAVWLVIREIGHDEVAGVLERWGRPRHVGPSRHERLFFHPARGVGGKAEMSDRVNPDPGKALSDLSPEQIQRNQRIYANIVAKYYDDPDFKAKVDADPARVLKAEGLEIPEGIEVRLLFNTEKIVHLVLPPRIEEQS